MTEPLARLYPEFRLHTFSTPNQMTFLSGETHGPENVLVRLPNRTLTVLLGVLKIFCLVSPIVFHGRQFLTLVYYSYIEQPLSKAYLPAFCIPGRVLVSPPHSSLLLINSCTLHRLSISRVKRQTYPDMGGIIGLWN